MKVICLVPSITETLIYCGVNVVGRSRFCIHPENKVSSIKKVGGTKEVDWQQASQLAPDIVILDKEENTLAMAESCPFEYIALHITKIDDVALELNRLAQTLRNKALQEIALRWQQLTSQSKPSTPIKLPNIPGVIEWWIEPSSQAQLEYLIWKDPYMAIGENTFIRSVLEFCGLGHYLSSQPEKYPKIELDQLSKSATCLLFSSEPFPFERYKKEMQSLGFACGLVDGEKFSWYGIRSLMFLEQLQDSQAK
ncbi:helical backbone metal receptor [Aliikangiella sp. IMCC44632]